MASEGVSAIFGGIAVLGSFWARRIASHPKEAAIHRSSVPFRCVLHIRRGELVAGATGRRIWAFWVDPYVLADRLRFARGLLQLQGAVAVAGYAQCLPKLHFGRRTVCCARFAEDANLAL